MSNNNNNISMAVIKRLPKYHRCLRSLLSKEVERISSKELSSIIGFTASQIRQDLNNFGGFGQQGYGYDVANLFGEINVILGLDKTYNTVIIGAGNLGHALANYSCFNNFGYKLKGIFEINPRLVGMEISKVEVYDIDFLEEFISNNEIDIAIICTNIDSAQKITDRLEKMNIKAIWNFAPVDVKVKGDIEVQNVHLVDNLLTLTYFIKDRK
jgi:redox-sensing transcriptional repressor